MDLDVLKSILNNFSTIWSAIEGLLKPLLGLIQGDGSLAGSSASDCATGGAGSSANCPS